jgi:hypothetical protein
MEPLREALPHPRARITGAVYLLYFLTAVSGGLFMRGIVVSGDAAATAANLLAHESLFRLGLSTSLIAMAFYVAMTALFYELFKPVNRSLALVAAFMGLAGCAVQTVSYLFDLAPLAVLGRAPYLSVFNGQQLQALALLFLKLQGQGETTSLVFFGLYDLLIGCLILRSTFLPRILGALMAIAGLGWLTVLSPTLLNHLSQLVLPLGFVAELLLMLWLLVKGVNVQRWREQASAAGERQ